MAPWRRASSDDTRSSYKVQDEGKDSSKDDSPLSPSGRKRSVSNPEGGAGVRRSAGGIRDFASRARGTVAFAIPRRVGIGRKKMAPRVSQIASPSSRRFYEKELGEGRTKGLGGLHYMMRKGSVEDVRSRAFKDRDGVLDRFLSTRLARPDDDHESEWVGHGRQDASASKKGRGLWTQCLIAEDSTAHLVWDVIVACFVIAFVAVAPLRYAFRTTNKSDFTWQRNGWLRLENLSDLAFIADLFINFRTAFYNRDGKLVTNQRVIAYKYVMGWFCADACASVPFSFFAERDGEKNAAVQWISFLRYSKLLRVARLARIYSRFLLLLNPGLIHLLRLCMILICAWHLIACIYWKVACMEGLCDPVRDYGLEADHSYKAGSSACLDDWAPYAGVRQKNLQTQYTIAMYWAIQVTTGIGGDINPDSNTQVALTIVAIVWGLLMFASVIGAMSSAVAALDAKGIQRTQALDKIRSYMSRRNIGRQVQNEIVNYYSFLLNANHDDDDSIDLTKLPVLLQIKLELALKHQKVKTIPLFRGLEPFAILTIVQNLRSFIALPTQLLFTADTHGSTMYVLDRGCVHLSLPQSMARITIGSPHKDKASDDFGALFPAGGLRPKRRNRSMYNMYAGGAAGPPVGGVRDAVPKEVEEAWRLALCDYEATSHGTISIEVLKLQGDYFGENTMLGQAHYTSARSEAYSELFALGFENMEHAVREFPKLAVRCARAVQMRRKRVKAAISVFLARQYTKSQGASKDAPSSQGLVMFEEKMSAAQTIQTWWENVNRDLDAEDILDLSDDDGDDGGDTKFKRSDIASLRDLRKTLTNIAPPVFSKGAPAAASDAAVSDASPAAAAAGAVVESADGSSVTIGRDEYAKLNDLLEKLHKSVETAERAKTEALREAPLEDHRQTLSRRRTTRLSVMQRSRIDEDGAYDAEPEQRTPRSRAGTRQGTGFQRPSQFPRHATGVAKRSMVSGGGRQFGSAPAMGNRSSIAGRVKVVAPREGGLAEVQPYRRGPASELGLVHPVADVEDAKDA